MVGEPFLLDIANGGGENRHFLLTQSTVIEGAVKHGKEKISRPGVLALWIIVEKLCKTPNFFAGENAVPGEAAKKRDGGVGTAHWYDPENMDTRVFM